MAEQYKAMFKIEEMGKPIAYYEHDWTKEEYSRGLSSSSTLVSSF